MFTLTYVVCLSFCLASQDSLTPPQVVDPTLRTSGEATSSYLQEPVQIDYDGFGVPTIRAEYRNDAFFAEGFVHAQNRFSQMDLSRRIAAGELAALVGPTLVARDQMVRGYRLRSIAQEVVAQMSEADRTTLDTYSAGVNAGLNDLTIAPPEYTILQTEPEPWKPEDTVLVMLAFAMLLEDSGQTESANAAMFRALPEELREYVYSPIARNDAPIRQLEARRPSLPRIPPREVISLRDLPPAPPTIDPNRDDEDHGDGELSPGSNNWVVTGSRTQDGRAILASDPHLGLTLPIAWYRIRLIWPGRDLVGISIPGIPGITMGSNGHVAWGFTNLTGDLTDLIEVRVDPDDASRYQTEDGWEPFGEVIETIDVQGGEPVELRLKTTRWGVVNARFMDEKGIERPAVTEWFALHPELINLDLFDIENAKTTEEAIEALQGWHGPPQNAVVADADGKIGYTVTGFLPSRPGQDGRAPYGLWDGGVSFTQRDQGTRPVAMNPAEEFLLTANNRTVGPRLARQLGYAWANPARAKRIEDVLATTTDTTEEEMLALQMDPTTVGLDSWKAIILQAIPEDEEDPTLQSAREAIVTWNGRADTDQVGITVLDRARRAMLDELSQGVAAWAREEGLGDFEDAYVHEEPYLRVIEDESPNWLPQGEAEDWRTWVRQHVRDVVNQGSLVPWGEVNQVTIASPLASMAPDAMARMLKIEAGPQSGYWNAPKVMGSSFGASARMVVSPGHEEDGIMLIPGGQSGNPFSPHYRSLNSSWIEGKPLPLLPGDTAATFTLVPAESHPKDDE